MKNVRDHAIQDGENDAGVIVVCPTYNNTSPEDSADYGLALRLTDNYHNELMNDLIPAVEESIVPTQRDFLAGTDGKPAATVLLPDFPWVRSLHGNVPILHGLFSVFSAVQRQSDPSDGAYMELLVTEAGYGSEDFFIYAMSGTEDLLTAAFTNQIQAMINGLAVFLLMRIMKGRVIWHTGRRREMRMMGMPPCSIFITV